jgi:hypothetical protein
MRIINAYGYDVTGSEDILNEIETDLKNKQVTINWSNFKNGDVLWNHNGNTKFFVAIDHENKMVVLDEK